MSNLCDSEGVSLAYDTGTAIGCNKERMPVVVIKALEGQKKEYDAEVNSYLSIQKARDDTPQSPFPSVLHHGHFDYPTPLRSMYGTPKCTVYYFVLEYLGPSLQDILDQSYYHRFTSKMTMAVAIQLVSPRPNH